MQIKLKTYNLNRFYSEIKSLIKSIYPRFITKKCQKNVIKWCFRQIKKIKRIN